MKGIFWKVFSCFPISDDGTGGLASLPTDIGSFLPVPREIYLLRQQGTCDRTWRYIGAVANVGGIQVEKYARQIGSWNPRERSENSKNVCVATTFPARSE